MILEHFDALGAAAQRYGLREVTFIEWPDGQRIITPLDNRTGATRSCYVFRIKGIGSDGWPVEYYSEIDFCEIVNLQTTSHYIHLVRAKILAGLQAMSQETGPYGAD